MDNPYVRLTHEFNEGRLRAVLASGQAVVLYRLAVMSKDGDWILREDDEALAGAQWPRLSRQLEERPLREAHERMVEWAAELLPEKP